MVSFPMFLKEMDSLSVPIETFSDKVFCLIPFSSKSIMPAMEFEIGRLAKHSRAIVRKTEHLAFLCTDVFSFTATNAPRALLKITLNVLFISVYLISSAESNKT